ncbi:UPF0149 family protein [Aliikangiella marina]|uniref:UPF0149 family protein n=1 Tax=Aliikangiella marina TaxID=1712262 RepID=A0A545TEI1_9GAMM|nr:UPF0149 family protein [Aliikangiella marina]TQV75628.1 UPF0149 family protein [Aliikangiella marina]
MSSFSIEALEACFSQPNISESFCSMHECLGLVAAVASSPDNIGANEWIEQIKRSPKTTLKFDNDEQLKEFTQNMVAWWQYCTTFFDHGHQLVLPNTITLDENQQANQSLIDFATGYLRGYSWLSATWQAVLPEEETEATRSLVVLNLILSRFINEEAVAKSEPEFYAQLPNLSECFKALPSLLSAVGMLGKDMAQNSSTESTEQKIESSINQLKNIGRNDPCPCGSGKKFKKCCLH